MFGNTSLGESGQSLMDQLDRRDNKAQEFWLWEMLEGAAPACVPLHSPHIIDQGVQGKG